MDTPLSDPISAECPCGPDLEYDPEYLLLFTHALAREEAQYGDFVSTPETINWAELERDAHRLLARSKDIRILVILLRCRIHQGGVRGLVETLTLLETLCATNPDTIHPQLLAAEDTTAEDAAVARSNALSALLDHEGVMADIRGITLSNNAFRFGMWNVRCLHHARRMRWHRNQYVSNWPTWKHAAHCRWTHFARPPRSLSDCNTMLVKRSMTWLRTFRV